MAKPIDFMKLKHKETGEHLDIERTFEWMLKEMPREDFEKIARLGFRVKGPDGYNFCYQYRPGGKDTPEARLDFIKYLLYKLVQNLSDERVELI